MSTPVVRQQKTRTRNARRGSRNRGSLPVTSSLRKLWDTVRRDVKYPVRQAYSLTARRMQSSRRQTGNYAGVRTTAAWALRPSSCKRRLVPHRCQAV